MDERTLINALAEAVRALDIVPPVKFDANALWDRVRRAGHENDIESVVGLAREDEWYAVLIGRGVPPVRWPELRRFVLTQHMPPPSGSFTGGAGRSTDPRAWNDYLIDGNSARLANLPGYAATDELAVWERLATIDACARTWPGEDVETSVDGLRSIHRHLFGEVFAWAGRVRTVGISKGDSRFTPPNAIVPALDDLFAQISSGLAYGSSPRCNPPSDHSLIDGDGAPLPTKLFAERLTPLFADLNTLHPFREGNGRTQRAMVAVIVERAGRTIDWRAMTGERMVDASIKAVADDLVPLTHLLVDCMLPEKRRRLRAVIGAFARNYETYELHGMTFRTLRSGETVGGRVAISGAPFAAVVDKAGTIIVADNDALSDSDAGMGEPVTLRS